MIRSSSPKMANPSFVANLVDAVYGIKDSRAAQIILSDFGLNKGASKSITATTGFRTINTDTAFAAFGTGECDNEKSIFLIFRGTEALNSKGADVVTDLRCAVTISDTGLYVHSGFNSTFETLKPKIAEYIESNYECSSVYCIGHSLGGAVAQLAADWVATRYSSSKTTKLYTFGSPRVGCGLHSFPEKITTKLRPENIYRVAHSSDPVTWLPFYPYIHAPTYGHPYYIQRLGLFFNPFAHQMKSYISSMDQMPNWVDHVEHPPKLTTSAIKSWLSSDQKEPSMSVQLWLKLNQAAKFIIDIIGVRAQLPIVAGATVIDHLAMILEKGKNLGGDESKWTFSFIKKLMYIIGRDVPESITEVTFSVIKSVLRQALDFISRYVQKAMSAI